MHNVKDANRVLQPIGSSYAKNRLYDTMLSVLTKWLENSDIKIFILKQKQSVN